MKKNILKQILFDKNQHWESFKKQHGERIRPVVIKEVERFRDCGNPKNALNSLFAKAVMTFEEFLIGVKVASAPPVPLERVKSGVAY